MEAPCISKSSSYLFLQGFVTDHVYVKPLPSDLHDLKLCIHVATAAAEQKTSQKAWYKFIYFLDGH